VRCLLCGVGFYALVSVNDLLDYLRKDGLGVVFSQVPGGVGGSGGDGDTEEVIIELAE